MEKVTKTVRLLLIGLVCVSIISCKRKTYIKNHTNGRSINQHIKVIEYFDNDSTKVSFQYFLLDSLIDSTYQSYFYNGKLKFEALMKRGTGLGREYLQNGELRYSGSYTQGEHNGHLLPLQHGTVLEYFLDGRVHFVLSYKMGILNGPIVCYDSIARLQYIGDFKNNYQDGQWYNFSDGKLFSIEEFYQDSLIKKEIIE